MQKELLKEDDYWIGVVFMLSANSATHKSCIAVDANESIIGSSTEKQFKNLPKLFHPEMKLILQNKNLSGCKIYLNYSPCFDCCNALLTQNVKSIIYYASEEVDSKILQLPNIVRYKGNLNWIRDYVNYLDIF